MNDDASAATHTDYLVPVDPDNQPIIWDNNFATLSGTLYEVGEYLRRKNLFRDLIQHRAALLPNGKLAVTDYSTVQFMTRLHVDHRDWTDPCPPTPDRIAKVNRTSCAGLSRC